MVGGLAGLWTASKADAELWTSARTCREQSVKRPDHPSDVPLGAHPWCRGLSARCFRGSNLRTDPVPLAKVASEEWWARAKTIRYDHYTEARTVGVHAVCTSAGCQQVRSRASSTPPTTPVSPSERCPRSAEACVGGFCGNRRPSLPDRQDALEAKARRLEAAKRDGGVLHVLAFGICQQATCDAQE